MAKYKVYFKGWYIIEADNKEEAINSSKEDFEVEYAEWENTKAVEARCYDG